MTEAAFPTVCLVGVGRLGGALLRGWLANGMPPSNIAIRETHPSAELTALMASHGLSPQINASPDILLLAVKPQMFGVVLREVAPLAGPNTAVVSVAAGPTTESIASAFPPNTGVIRTLPNLPAEVGRGITALYANGAASEASKFQCETLFKAVGQTVWLSDESQMDAVTGLSGSGPAYVFYMAECLAAAGEAVGLAPDVAMALARATVSGAGELLHRLPASAAQLRENVTSPAGTTAAGLAVLMDETGMQTLITKSVAAAVRRSKELSKSSSTS